MRHCCWLLAALLFGVHAEARAQAPSKKLNILFIVADDLNDALGCYGHPLVKSPHIDQLAARGVRFDRAYCQNPICNVSRTSFLSGRYSGSKLTDVVFLPDFLRKHGYFTMEIPKIAHSYGITRTTIKWDISEAGGTAKAIALLEEHKDKTFFLGVGLQHTHDAVFNRPFRNLYPAEKITWPNESADAIKAIPATAFKNINVQQVSDDERRDRIGRYYASISTLDAEVGKLLAALDRLKLSDSTLVVFTSDHGKHKGEHGGVWDKRTLFEASVRVPLIVAGPGIPGKSASPRLVELVDLYPTFAEMAGLPIAGDLQGVSLVPLLKEPQRPWKKAAFTIASVNGGRSVRTERYRYSEWGNGAALLYDYETDPHELRNLASDPQHQETVAQMRALLKAGWQAAKPAP